MITTMDSDAIEAELRARGIWEEMTKLPGHFGLIYSKREFFYRQHGFEDPDRNLMAWTRCEPSEEAKLKAMVADLRVRVGLCFEAELNKEDTE